MERMRGMGLAAGVVLLSMAGPGEAFGDPWTATGLALAPDGSLHDIHVQWSGWSVRTFTVTLSAYGGPVESVRTFAGVTGGDAGAVPFYQGHAQIAGAFSTDPGVDFRLHGAEAESFDTGAAVLAGTYEGHVVQVRFGA